jgi:outer membrane protein OmpA-like peptidoglycan-associated protein
LNEAVQVPGRFVGLSESLEPICAGGLPEPLLAQMTHHPNGWWDFMRMAFREELKDPENSRARTAWQLDVQANLVSLLGESTDATLMRLDKADQQLDRRWAGLREFRDEFGDFAASASESLEELKHGVLGLHQKLDSLSTRILVPAIPEHGENVDRSGAFPATTREASPTRMLWPWGALAILLLAVGLAWQFHVDRSKKTMSRFVGLGGELIGAESDSVDRLLSHLATFKGRSIILEAAGTVDSLHQGKQDGLGGSLRAKIETCCGFLRIAEWNRTEQERTPLVLVAARSRRGTDGPNTLCTALVDLGTSNVIARDVVGPIVDPDAIPKAAVTMDGRDASLDSICLNAVVGSSISRNLLRYLDARLRLSNASNPQLSPSERLDVLQSVLGEPGIDTTRTLNALYLAARKLGEETRAMRAFAAVISSSFDKGVLSLKFLFAPDSAEFLSDPAISAPYRKWIEEIAFQTALRGACLQIIGHSSRSEDEKGAMDLSLRRADKIKRELLSTAPQLEKRISVSGMGFRENIIGSGTNDLTDALDRRVEFLVVACS